jgi:histone deacetylase 1/2
MENANSHDYLHKIKSTVIDNIRRTGRPSVEAFTTIPDGPLTRADSDDDEDDDLDADLNPDVRMTQRQRDQQITRDDEFDDPSDDEDYRNSLGVRHQPGQPRRRHIYDFPNANAAPADDLDEGGVLARTTNGGSGRTTNQPSPAAGRRSASLASSTHPAANGSTSARMRTPVPAADDDGDIDMDIASADEEGSASALQGTAAGPGASVTSHTVRAASTRSPSPAGVLTPPEEESPPPATGTEDVDMTALDDAQAEEVQREKDGGYRERAEEDERGEAETEAKRE